MLTPFKNEQLTDFSIGENREKMLQALNYIESQLNRSYDLIIGGKRISTPRKITSVNPSDFNQVVGSVSKADKEHVAQTIETASEVFKSWRNVHPYERARYLIKGAAILRRRKYEFAAWMVYEIGKSWAEADADVAEAIDFMEFYGREMYRYAQRQNVTPFPNEENEVAYVPLGVGAVIPPWNFPVAILVGMTTAALVTGNTVVLKPSSDTPVVAAKFMEILEEADLPPGVVNFLPGSGGEVGDTLVLHPKTRFVAFTGSMEVGLRINELASRTSPGQIWIKRVVAEMGGKDTMIIDSSANLENAAIDVVNSAFGFQGQKCSACSRTVVMHDIYDRFLSLITEKAKNFRMGEVKNPENNFGPVASKSAFESIMNYIETGKKEGRLILGGNKGSEKGYFIMPTIIADIKPEATISQEEIFGPVLAVLKAQNFDHALQIANNTKFGLTGGVYSNSRTNLERARREFHVGNLYFNRKITGAFVDVQPFGGFNMSGTDSKAGGRDYLLLFLQAKTVTERF